MEAREAGQVVARTQQQVGRLLLDDDGNATADLERLPDDVESADGAMLRQKLADICPEGSLEEKLAYVRSRSPLLAALNTVGASQETSLQDFEDNMRQFQTMQDAAKMLASDAVVRAVTVDVICQTVG